MLEVKGLYKKFDDTIINDISFKISSGEIVSIECIDSLGEMLIKLILGKELPGKGEILVNGLSSGNFIKQYGLQSLGVIFSRDGYYKELTVDQYLRFFSKLLNYKGDYRNIMMKLALLDIGNTKIKKLSYQQKRRLSFARERLKDLKLLFFQEPILNTDSDNSRIIMENIQELLDQGVAILCTSVSYKDTLMLGGKSFTLDGKGLVEVTKESEGEEELEDFQNGNNAQEGLSPSFKVEKIPAKFEDKLLLFDPFELDFIESEHGISNLSVRGEKFPCNISLADLETRLKSFGFFRSHRSYLVNLQRVREVVTWTRNSYSLNLDDKNKTSIPLSKGRLEELKKILNL